MRTYTPAQVQSDIDGLLNAAQSDKVVIVRNGKPTAVVIGVEDYDAENIETASSPDFWRMIQERRSSGGAATLDEVRRRLGLSENRSIGDAAAR